MLKSILYLDDAKLHSLVSQLAERASADVQTPGGENVGSISRHDPSLSRFETKLAELGLLDSLTAPSAGGMTLAKPFVRIEARASFIDANRITSLLASFNELGEALAHVTSYSEIESVRKEIQQLAESSKDKPRLADLRQLEKRLTDTADVARRAGLYQDPKFLKHLAVVAGFSFSDQLEVQQRVGQRLFSACLKQACLRESKDMLVRKYSRKTERALVVLGVVTQSEPASNADDEALPETMSVREAVTNMVDHVAKIESTMMGKTSYEVVVDPIAVYVSL